jgi:hypothetical protein
MQEKIFVLWGELAVQNYFDITERKPETVQMLLDHIDEYEFDTPEEAEAFRQGMCAVKCDSAEDFCELTETGVKSLRSFLVPPKKVGKKSPRFDSSAKLCTIGT